MSVDESPEPDEWALVQRAQAGDRSAFEQLYRLNVGWVYGLCLRMSQRREQAEELTQETFVRAWQHLGQFAERGHFAAWLHRVAVNLVLNERRVVARRGVMQPLLDDESTAAGTPAPNAVRLDLEQAVGQLPEGSRLVFLLCDVLGYRHDEVASITGRAVGTTKTQLHRARRRLREVLQ